MSIFVGYFEWGCLLLLLFFFYSHFLSSLRCQMLEIPHDFIIHKHAHMANCNAWCELEKLSSLRKWKQIHKKKIITNHMHTNRINHFGVYYLNSLVVFASMQQANYFATNKNKTPEVVIVKRDQQWETYNNKNITYTESSNKLRANKWRWWRRQQRRYKNYHLWIYWKNAISDHKR